MNNAKMVKVVFNRKKSPVLWSSTFIINVDGENITFLRNGETVEVEIPQGKHEITINGCAYVGGKMPTRLVSTSKEVKKEYDFQANKTIINISSKVGWINHIVIDENIVENNDEIQIKPKNRKLTFVVEDNEYMQHRLELQSQNYITDTYVGIKIDGMNMPLVKNEERKVYELEEGKHTIKIVSPFKRKEFEERTLDLSQDNLIVYLELSAAVLERNSYRYECKISRIENDIN